MYTPDRKSTRLNSSHLVISYAVFCLKKKTNEDLLIFCRTCHLLAVVAARVCSSKSMQQGPHGSPMNSSILRLHSSFFFFFNDTATTEIYTLSLPDALPI